MLVKSEYYTRTKKFGNIFTAYAMKACAGMYTQLRPFWTSVLLVEGGDWSDWCNGCFTPEERTPCTHWKLAESQKRSGFFAGKIKLTTPDSVYRNAALRSAARGLVTIDYAAPAPHPNNHDILMSPFWISCAFKCAASHNLYEYVGNVADLTSAQASSYSCGLLQQCQRLR